MFEFLKDKTVLVTGGTGSFGRQFVETVLQESACKKVIIFSRDEWKQWEMHSLPAFQDPRIRFFLGDIREERRLRRAFHDVDIVIHAAALKQVPAAEYNPSEFVKTNILGANNIIHAAIDCGVENVIALSSDKAVNPLNLYGATKLCSDKLFIAGNNYVGQAGKPVFSIVRYGNVLGSRGSVIPFWKKALADGAKSLPLTDKSMTRFWISLDEAVEFVIKALPRMVGGEIFVPKIPSMKMTEMAEALAPGVPLEVTGIRPGEKLHEILISADDACNTYELPDAYLILPSDQQELVLKKYEKQNRIQGVKVPDTFVFRSDSNPNILSKDSLLKRLS